MFALSPLLTDDERNGPLPDDVCLATGFWPREGSVTLNVKDGPLNVSTSSAVLSHSLTSYFLVAFTNQTLFSCEMNSSSSNNDNVDLCTDLHPERVRLNSFLLLMNGIRVLFTKTVAFSAAFTIRALLA